MTRDEALLILRRRQAELRRLGIEHLYLFGSTARDESRADSDVDLFFDHAEGSLGLFQLMDIKDGGAHSRPQNRYHDTPKPPPATERAHRSIGFAGFLMGEHLGNFAPNDLSAIGVK